MCNPIGILKITGDCENTNSGAYTLDIVFGAEPFIILPINPPGSPINLPIGTSAYTQTGLSAGTYSIRLFDTCGVESNNPIFNFKISSGTCVSIEAIGDTTCGFDNGEVRVTTTNIYNNYSYFYLYEQDDTYVTSGSSVTPDFIFTDLPSGYYYVVADDGGGCTGRSESFLIKSSTTVDFGFYVINNTGCGSNTGAIYITGLTGTPPYTYSWSNGGTDSFITGLTQGSYSVTVTDSGSPPCSFEKGIQILNLNPLGFGEFIYVSPTCFNSDGEIKIVVTGGTPPYYYYNQTTGQNEISFSQFHIFTGLSSGNYTIQVTDAALCTFTQSTTLLTPNVFSIIGLTVTNSSCNDNSGSLNVNLVGGTTPYTVTITDSSSNTTTLVQGSPIIFNGLSSGNYTVEIEDNGEGTCNYVNTFIIDNDVKFTLDAQITGTTCNSVGGIVELTISSGGTTPYVYEIQGVTTFTTASTAHTFNNLTPGNYNAIVTDSTFCSQILPITIPTTSDVNIVTYITQPLSINDGGITLLISGGTPPYDIEWSDNVNGQTGITVNNLTAGTYNVTVTDVIGCSITETIILTGFNALSNYQTFNVCSSTLVNNGLVIIKNIKSMLLEGFHDLTEDNFDCVLNSAIFIAQVSVGGFTKEEEVYTGYGLNDYPTNELWYNTISEMLLSFNGISEVLIKDDENTIETKTDCEVANLDGEQVLINLKIKYDISCITPPTPTPTPSPTPTPTPTATPIPTPVPTAPEFVMKFTSGSLESNLNYFNPINTNITFSSLPNDVVTFEMNFIRLINFSGITKINSILYPENVTSTFTMNTDSLGNGNIPVYFEYPSYPTPPNPPIIGQKIVQIKMISSMLGASLTLTPDYDNVRFPRVSIRNLSILPYYYTYIGKSFITDLNSGDACNNFSPETIYKLETTTIFGYTTPPPIGSLLYSGLTGADLVYGDDKWIAITMTMVPRNGNQRYSLEQEYNYIHAVQVNSSGVITNVVSCPNVII